MSTDAPSLAGVPAPGPAARYLVAAAVVAVGLCLGACESRAQPQLDDIAMPDGAPRDAVERSARALVAALEAEGPADAVTFDVRDLGEGLFTVRAFQEGSYPGTGNASLVLTADGRTFGIHGEHDLAELVRERGWLAGPPAADWLLRLLDAAVFEGSGSTSPTEPALETGPDGLEIRFERFVPPGPSFAWRATFPPEGPTRLETRDASASDPDAWAPVPPR